MVRKSMVLGLVLSGLALVSGGSARAAQNQVNQPGVQPAGNTQNVKNNRNNKTQPTSKKSSGVQDQDTSAKKTSMKNNKAKSAKPQKKQLSRRTQA
jgi:hypothetical protein